MPFRPIALRNIGRTRGTILSVAAAGDDPNELREAAAFRIALRRFEARSQRAVRHAGLTPRQYLLLLVISGAADGRPATMTRLADHLQLAQSTVTELVDRCEAAGLVTRNKAEDGRVSVVALTPKGRRRFDRAFGEIRHERHELAEWLERGHVPDGRPTD